jgi:CcmD family protein
MPPEEKEPCMDARNFTFMFYGFLAAWLIVMLYVVSLARRSARLRKELQDVRNLVNSGQGASLADLEDQRVR